MGPSIRPGWSPSLMTPTLELVACHFLVAPFSFQFYCDFRIFSIGKSLFLSSHYLAMVQWALPKKLQYILLSGGISRAFGWDHAAFADSRHDCVAMCSSCDEGHICTTRARAGVIWSIFKVSSKKRVATRTIYNSANRSAKEVYHI